MYQTRFSIAAVVLLSCLIGAPGRPGEPCLRDAPPYDGHPIFGHPHFRCTLVAEPTDDFAATCFTVADFDGDSDLDVAITNQEFYSGTGPAHLTVLLNKGDGIFEDPVPYELARHPTAVVSGDVDGDLDIDLAVSSAATGTTAVLKNNGDGTFAPRVEYPVGANPRSLALADLDGDVDLDLVVMNQGSNTISALSNNGDGTFAPQVTYPAGTVSFPPSDGWRYGGPFLAVGDLDGDSDVDVIVPARERISVMMNNGDGSFAPLVSYQVPYATSVSVVFCVIVGDWDRDDDLDLATIVNSLNAASKDLSIFMNNGDGTFAAPVSYDIDTQPAPTTLHRAAVVAAEDLDADGDLDLAIAYHSPNTVGVVYNNGDGTFAPVVRYIVDEDQRFLGLADVSGDGHPDLAVLAKSGRYKRAVLFNKGNGTFHNYFSYPEYLTALGPPPEWNGVSGIATDDLDRDGDLDLIISVLPGNRTTGNVFIMLNDGRGNFTETGPYRLGQYIKDIAVGHLDGDMYPDIAVADLGPDLIQNLGKVWVMLNKGDGTYWDAVPHPVDGSGRGVTIGDVDGDSHSDLIVGNGALEAHTVSLLTNMGDGTFAPFVPYDAGVMRVTEVAVGDFDGDRSLDLVCTSGATSAVGLLFNDAAGGFSAPILLPANGTTWSVLALDVSRDGKLDIATGVAGPTVGYPNASFYLNDGIGGFPLRVDYTATGEQGLQGLSHGCVDRNSATDLVAVGDIGASVMLDSALGVFDPSVPYGTGGGPRQTVAGDFDGDRSVDVATSNEVDDNFSLLWHRSCAIAGGDLDGDGDVDLSDFTVFQLCFGGSNNPPAGTCPPGIDADLDDDGDVDLADFLIFQQNFTGSQSERGEL